MAQRIVFTGKQQVTLESFELPALAANQVQVRTLCTLMSTGTENICFNRLFEPNTHWDWWVKYPFYPGYLNVGVVEAVGSEVKNWKVGQRVYARENHRSHYQFADDSTGHEHLPDTVNPEHATWYGLVWIAATGARAAEYRVADKVAIVGAGPIGQMSVRWAAAAGAADIVVIDMVPERLDMAKKGGATAVVAQPVDQAVEAVKQACGGVQPRVAIDATGHPGVFAKALGLPAKFGKLVLLGDCGTPSEQRLTIDIVARGLTVVGAHDSHGNSEFNARLVYQYFINLVSTGRFPLDGLITHRFKPTQYQEAYTTANTKRGQTMGILFDWQ